MRNLASSERHYAEFYRLYTRDFRQDIVIYREFAAKFKGPVLEIGCRAGRVSGALAEAGYDVVGIDTSRPMLETAARQLRAWPDRARVADFDLRGQPMPQRFPVVLVPLFSFNDLIDVEEQRLFLRHARRSMCEPGVLILDLFCPLSMARPDEAQDWRRIERVAEGHAIEVRDRREMLTPLLERRTQVFRIEGGVSGEHVMHRRYITPQHAANLLEEAGYGSVRWVQDYDLTTARTVEADDRPSGPFLMIGEL